MKKHEKYNFIRYDEAVVLVTEYLLITAIAITSIFILIIVGGTNPVHVYTDEYSDSEAVSASLAISKFVAVSDDGISSSAVLYYPRGNCQVFLNYAVIATNLVYSCHGTERNIEFVHEKPLKITPPYDDIEQYSIKTGGMVYS